VAAGALAALIVLPRIQPSSFDTLARNLFTPVLPAAADGGTLATGGSRATLPLTGTQVILSAFHWTLLYTVVSFTLSLGVGIIVGLMRSVESIWLRLPASIYVETIRGIPLLVLLFATYFSLNRPFEWGDRVIHIGPFWAATCGIVLCYGAFLGEVVRGGIESIPREQLEAAYIEGSHLQVAWHVTIPLALRRMLPAVNNEFVALLKDSSLLCVLGITEVTMAGRSMATANFHYFQTYAYVALVYLVITLLLSKFFRLVEKYWVTA
jgi:polar amino acid transport system permease protein